MNLNLPYVIKCFLYVHWFVYLVLVSNLVQYLSTGTNPLLSQCPRSGQFSFTCVMATCTSTDDNGNTSTSPCLLTKILGGTCGPYDPYQMETLRGWCGERGVEG